MNFVRQLEASPSALNYRRHWKTQLPLDETGTELSRNSQEQVQEAKSYFFQHDWTEANELELSQTPKELQKLYDKGELHFFQKLSDIPPLPVTESQLNDPTFSFRSLIDNDTIKYSDGFEPPKKRHSTFLSEATGWSTYDDEVAHVKMQEINRKHADHGSRPHPSNLTLPTDGFPELTQFYDSDLPPRYWEYNI